MTRAATPAAAAGPDRSAAAAPASGETAPLLADRAAAHDDIESGALPTTSPTRWARARRATVTVLAAATLTSALAILVVLIFGAPAALIPGDTPAPPIAEPVPAPAPRPRKRNLVMMVSDGFGPASETFGRTMYAVLTNASIAATPLDKLLVGQSRTRSTSSLVTDSAAGATAFSCAQKSYNGAIAVTADQRPCATVLEAAAAMGYKTGLVVTSRITHATPASFNAHVLWRDYENDIAEQQVHGVVGLPTTDLMLGGGRRHFLPQSNKESVRDDDRDLLAEARARGVSVLTTRSDFDATWHLPTLGVFTPDHMAFDLDRNPAKEPSLAEMAQRALEVLDQAVEKDDDAPGFFLMVEGSRIDMAAHSNDPGAHAHDIAMYYQTVEVVKKWVDKHWESTVMVSTSDHETGGLSLARQVSAKYPEYKWNPATVARQRKSAHYVGKQILALEKRSPKHVATLIADLFCITDLTPAELAYLTSPIRTLSDLEYFLGDTVVSTRAELGWATHGHSAVDVNLYAHGQGVDALRGNVENTDVGKFLHEYLGVGEVMTELTQVMRANVTFKHPTMPPPKGEPGLVVAGMGRVESDEVEWARMAGHF
ncbi:hypothetical protein GGF32_004245 [Allomyces javanicus]|nr:hypothetical protein GGF32_004245 [Allomyces javanicus]